MNITVSSPGKVILHGEHAVVYGKSAVAASIDLRSHLELTLNKEDKVSIELAAVGIRRSWSVQEIALAVQLPEDVKDDNTAISGAVKTGIKKLIDDASSSQKEELALTTFLFLYTSITGRKGTLPAVDIKIHTDIPIGAGLGSSASLSVCLVTALLMQQGLVTPPKQNSTGLNWSDADLHLISKWAFEGERIIHGRPSGIDNSVATYGGAIKFQGGKITHLEKMPSLRILLINTRVPRNTKNLVAGVKDRHDKYPDIIQHVLESIEAVSERSQATYSAMVAGEHNGSHYKILEELIDFNRYLLEIMGVSHSAVDKVCQITSKFHLHSKLTGAGGGGCCFTLLRPDTSDEIIDKIKNILDKENFDCWETTLGVCGVEATIVTK